MGKSSIRLKSPDDIMRIRESGRIISELFGKISSMSLDGISTWELDSFIDDYIYKKKARAAFKTVLGYNFASSISIDNEVVHGIPMKKKIIKNSNILKVDIGIVCNGYLSDSCCTFPIGKIGDGAKSLINSCKESLIAGIEEMKPGNRLGDIGAAIQNKAECRGFNVVKKFSGHGTGFELHEPPSVPHFGKRGTGLVLEEGLVIAIEPILNEGLEDVEGLEDKWTVVTADGKLSAQFEHTVAVTKNGPLVLTE
ncbi:type I methionyl aminopeptidase [Spirochaetota bacterium]